MRYGEVYYGKISHECKIYVKIRDFLEGVGSAGRVNRGRSRNIIIKFSCFLHPVNIPIAQRKNTCY